jgi:hypothetical protein
MATNHMCKSTSPIETERSMEGLIALALVFYASYKNLGMA